MSRKPGIFKQDRAAIGAWGSAYASIPKSVFALVAWHLANIASDMVDEDGAAKARFLEELEILRDGGHLPAAQANRAVKALRSS